MPGFSKTHTITKPDGTIAEVSISVRGSSSNKESIVEIHQKLDSAVKKVVSGFAESQKGATQSETPIQERG